MRVLTFSKVLCCGRMEGHLCIDCMVYSQPFKSSYWEKHLSEIGQFRSNGNGSAKIQWRGSGSWPFSDPVLCTSTEGTCFKIYWMNVLANFKSILFSYLWCQKSTKTKRRLSKSYKYSIHRLLNISLRSRYRALNPNLAKTGSSLLLKPKGRLAAKKIKYV